jgi:hypothetical protein
MMEKPEKCVLCKVINVKINNDKSMKYLQNTCHALLKNVKAKNKENTKNSQPGGVHGDMVHLMCHFVVESGAKG